MVQDAIGANKADVITHDRWTVKEIMKLNLIYFRIIVILFMLSAQNIFAQDFNESKPKLTVNKLLTEEFEQLNLPVDFSLVVVNKANNFSSAINTPNLYTLISNSVVKVFRVEKSTEKQRLVGRGSGVAISSSLIITNCHVIGDGTDNIFIEDKFKLRLRAQVLSSDEKTDRCVLKVENAQLSPVRGYRSISSLQIGERVFSLGNPKGFDFVIAEGLLSSIKKRGNRQIILTSAATAKGSSGGGLFDETGNLIGITTAVIGDAPHLGIAIPAEDFLLR